MRACGFGRVGDAPAELLILRVMLAEPPGDFRARELDTEIEGMGAIMLDRGREGRKKGEGIGRDAMEVTVIKMDAILRELDAEIRIAELRLGLGDLLATRPAGTAIMERQKPGIEPLGETLETHRRPHDAPRAVGFLDGVAAMRRFLHGEHLADAELGDHAEEQGIDPGGVGIGELGDIADPHEDTRTGQAAAKFGITQERGGEAEGNGGEDRIGDEGAAFLQEPLTGAIKRGEIIGPRRNDHRGGVEREGEIERGLIEAQNVMRSRRRPAFELAEIGGIDTHLEARFLDRGDCFFKMWKRGLGETTEIDHLGTVGGVKTGERHDRLGRTLGRVGDLGKDAHVRLEAVDRFTTITEIVGQLMEILGAALDAKTELAPKCFEIAAAKARDDHPVGAERALRQTPADDLGGHEGGDLDADIMNGPGKIEAGKAREHVMKALFREMSGQEEGVPRHVARRLNASSSWASESTTWVASNCRSRSTFSRSMRRGKTFTSPPGAMVRSSGAVSQAKTIEGTRHLPACAKTLVASVSEMPVTNFATVFEVAGATMRVW